MIISREAQKHDKERRAQRHLAIHLKDNVAYII